MSQSTDSLAVLPACDQPLGIVCQERGFVVVDKPARLLSVPGRHPDNYDSVVYRLRRDHPGVHAVHRLDYDTSGLLVVPLDKPNLSHLSRQFQARSVQKRYTAVVAGQVAQDAGVMEWPISRDWERRPRSKIDPEGKPARTEYRVIARDERSDTTRLALYPVTGRSHQLRLHCAELGHPILGCGFYAPEPVRERAPRLLLHAEALGFRDPDGERWRSFESPAPF